MRGMACGLRGEPRDEMGGMSPGTAAGDRARRGARRAALAATLVSSVALAEPPHPAAAPAHAPSPTASVPSASPPATASPVRLAPPKAAHAQGATARAPRTPPPRYRQYVNTWHTPAANRAAPLDEAGQPKLVLVSLNTGDRFELAAATPRGGFAASDLDRAAHVLRDTGSGNEHPVEPRVLDVVYRIQTHFQAQEIRVISGYRTPHGRSSNHGRGRAVDIVVPGASDADVAKFAREVGFCGVGIYPSSGFVHVDVRDRSYFWVDASAPGRRNRERGILGDLASRSDAQAVARGELRIGPFAIGTDVDAALRAREVQPGGAVSEPDDDTDDDAEPAPTAD
jgi:uncharacterized protein YcbK (DUF882 family)